MRPRPRNDFRSARGRSRPAKPKTKNPLPPRARKAGKPLYSRWKADLKARGVKTKPLYSKKRGGPRPSIRKTHGVRNPSRYRRVTETREVAIYGPKPTRTEYREVWDPNAGHGFGGYVRKGIQIPTGAPRPVIDSRTVKGRIKRLSKRRGGGKGGGGGNLLGKGARKTGSAASIKLRSTRQGGTRGARVGREARKQGKK